MTITEILSLLARIDENAYLVIEWEKRGDKRIPVVLLMRHESDDALRDSDSLLAGVDGEDAYRTELLVERLLRERGRPAKDWSVCSYPAHSDDCDCNGVAGDR